MGYDAGGHVLRLWIALPVWMVWISSAQAACESSRVDLRGDWGSARFMVELAITPEERSQGLMHRTSLSGSAGMFFIYDSPQKVAFWMANTLIPLDMLFLSTDGVVQHVHYDAKPLDRTLISGGDNIRYVLEINGGLSRRIGISKGTELRHPMIEQSAAAWPCVDVGN